MTELDAVELEVARHRLEGVAEEMGRVLTSTAYSPNIREREDCSTALFDRGGRMVAQAEHIPVHLGAMPASVEAVMELNLEWGDVAVLNDPYRGGSHLPDVTMVSPVYHDDGLLGYAASRAHHADVGGVTPGSMPADSGSIHEEGVRVPPVKVVEDGDVVEDVLDLLLANVRAPGERRADLRAQMAANERGVNRLEEFAEEFPATSVFDGVVEYSRSRVEGEIRELEDGCWTAVDYLEDGGNDVEIQAEVEVDGGSVAVDFTGTDEQVDGNLNAPPAVARSAVYFVVRCVTDPDAPSNHGCYSPVSVEVEEGSLLDPRPPAAVAGGNVETSQRVVDVVFEAFRPAAGERVPAQGQGTMNNTTVGNDGFAYYETVGGGAGATADADGLSGVHVGMSNTLNTPVEALEREYPLRVERYTVRRGSGGDGRRSGGDGVVRRIRLLEAAELSLLTDRRRHPPKGASGGEDGEVGRNQVNDDVVEAKTTMSLEPGDTVTVETPSGGGYGEPSDEDEGSPGEVE